MANLGEVLVDGTQYSITGGVALVGGTQYAIDSGVTLRAGTEYDIGESSDDSGDSGDTGGSGTCTVTVTGGMNSNMAGLKAYVTSGGSTYTSGSFTVSAGSTVTISRKAGTINSTAVGTYSVAYKLTYADGTTSTSTYTAATASMVNNTITITQNTTIAFLRQSISGGGSGGEIM